MRKRGFFLKPPNPPTFEPCLAEKARRALWFVPIVMVMFGIDRRAPPLSLSPRVAALSAATISPAP